MSLPIKPIIPDACIIRHGKRPYAGPIEPGQVFAWEPDRPHARELIVVTRVSGEWIFARNIDSDEEFRNSEGRFREAVCATILKPHPIKRNTGPVPWPFK